MFCPSCGKEMKKIRKDYHYAESGLKNVILGDLTVYTCSCGEEMPLIPHLEQLHRVIAVELIKSKSLLSGDAVRFLRKQLGMKAVELSRVLGVSKTTVSRWENGDENIGPANDRLLKSLVVRKVEEEMEGYIKLSVLEEIFAAIPQKHPSRHFSITIPVDKLADYDYGLDFCRDHQPSLA